MLRKKSDAGKDMRPMHSVSDVMRVVQRKGIGLGTFFVHHQIMKINAQPIVTELLASTLAIRQSRYPSRPIALARA